MNIKKLGDAELEIMDVLWDSSEPLTSGYILEKSIFRTAEMLDFQGFSPFLYACLSLISTSRYRKIIEIPA